MRLVFYFIGWWKSTALICFEGCERVLAKPSSWLTGSHLMCHHTLFLVSVCWYFLLMRTPVILHQSSQGWPQFNMIPSAENLPPIRSQFQKLSQKFSLGKSILVSSYCYGKILWPKATWGGQGLCGLYVQVTHSTTGNVRVGTSSRTHRAVVLNLSNAATLLVVFMLRAPCPQPQIIFNYSFIAVILLLVWIVI